MITLGRGVHGLLVLALLTGVAGCATSVVIENPSQPISQFELRQSQHGVEIAIDPIIEPTRLQQYFVTDLLHGFNILPVFIVMQNQQDTPILVQNGSFTLIDGTGRSLAQSAPISTTGPLVRKAANIEETMAPIHWLAALSGSPVAFLLTIDLTSRMTSSGDYRAAADNIVNRALYDRVVYKGEDHRGFIYFGIENQEMIKRIAKLQVEIKAVTTDQALVLMFDLDLAKEEGADERAAGR